MEDLKKFINEVLNFEIRIIHYPLDPKKLNIFSVKHYREDHGYKAKLEALQNAALVDIALLSDDQKKGQLKRVQSIFTKLEKSVSEWNDLESRYISGRRIDKNYLDNESFLRFLQVPQYDQGFGDDDFVYDLFEAIQLKYGCFYELMYHLKEQLGIRDDDNAFIENEPLEPSNNQGQSLSYKLLFLYLFKRDRKLDREKHVNLVFRKFEPTPKDGSLRNAYRALEKYLDNKLYGKEITTFENYEEELTNPETVKKIKAALKIS
jgi:hypothetical protein